MFPRRYGPLVHPTLRRLDHLAASLEHRGDVVAVLGLGSAGVETERFDARTAHSLVGRMVAEAGDTRDPDELAAVFADVFARDIGRPWQGDGATFASVVDLRRIVSSRSGIGSCGPAALRAMIDDIRAWSAAQRTAVARRRDDGDFPYALLGRVQQILNGNG